ncbi:MAG TPA: hypothetical protein VNZ67_07425, partial [bacterium]|nr:hypothetical protein [bacterium]
MSRRPGTILPLVTALLLAAGALRASWPATDSFGYQAAAVPQSWTDISGSGTAIPNASFAGGPDDGSVQVNLPFNFKFYGSIFTKTYLRPNGYVQFSNPDSVFDPFTCPLNSLGQKGIVAAFWMDLDLTNSGVVYTQVTGSTPNRVMVIQYTDVPPHGGGAGQATFQIQLGEDNSIVFSYNDTGTLGSGSVAVAGLASFYDCPNRDALTLSCDQANLVSGLCLQITYPALEPACGTPTFTTSPSDTPTITVSPTRSFTASPSPTASPTASDSP